MQKVFLETSIFIRFLTKDDPEKFEDCVSLFRFVELGKVRPYTSNIVITEILFVLTRTYKFSKQDVLQDLEKVLLFRNLTLIEKTNTKRALWLFQKYAMKYGDCLIATQVPKGVILATYDKDFAKIPSLIVLTPREVTANLENEK